MLLCSDAAELFQKEDEEGADELAISFHTRFIVSTFRCISKLLALMVLGHRSATASVVLFQLKGTIACFTTGHAAHEGNHRLFRHERSRTFKSDHVMKHSFAYST